MKLFWAFFLGLVIGGFAVQSYYTLIPSTEIFGAFQGQVETIWLDDAEDREMELLSSFSYIDPANKTWIAKKGDKINGASIPQVFWTIIGSPYDGAYRKASVIHDAACTYKTEPAKEVHRMFYYACRCDGLSESKAKVMYFAVKQFGPDWQLVAETRTVMSNGKEVTLTVKKPVQMTKAAADEADQLEQMKAAIKLIESKNPSLEELDQLNAAELPKP
ncbi:MAG: DUF1353 domain-containing protein [Pirellulales bacterium]|nr:DUF1353 domain-containing protein [Pirellulales bacterium]